MEKNKINIDRPEISSERINSHKNFDSLQGQFSQAQMSTATNISKVLIKSTKFWIATSLSAVAIGLIAYLGFISPEVNTENIVVVNDSLIINEAIISDTNIKAFVNPPSKELDIKNQIFTISNNKDTIIETSSGSKIIISKNTFVNNNGDIINKDITLTYREFHDAVDFFVSGINMEYDSAGVNYTFESAGMLELRAFVDSSEVQIAHNKDIDIEMISHNSDDNFNQYYLNEESEKWEYICENNAEIIKGKSIEPTIKANESTNKIVKNENIDTVIPVKPGILNENKYAFKIDFDKNKFKELALYNNLLFEINDKKCEFNENLYSVEWESINLANSNIKDNYTIKLQRKDEEAKLVAFPVVKSDNYKEAIASYNNKVTKIENQKAIRRQEIENSAEEIASKKKSITNSLRNSATRKMTIRTTGIYNYDKAIMPPFLATNKLLKDELDLSKLDHNNANGNYDKEIKIRISDNKGRPLDYEIINFVDLSKNALFRVDPDAKIFVDNNAKIVMWVINMNGDICIIDSKQFSIESSNKDIVIFKTRAYNKNKGVKLLKKLINPVG